MHWRAAKRSEPKVKGSLDNVDHTALELPLVWFISGGLAGLGGLQATPKYTKETVYRHGSEITCCLRTHTGDDQTTTAAALKLPGERGTDIISWGSRQC